jgi:hypothetical protein
MDINRSVYLLKLREVPFTSKLYDSPLEVLRERLNKAIKAELSDSSFEDSILILDGLDELAMLEDLTTNKIDNFLEKLIESLRAESNLKVVITSRYGYLNHEKLAEREEEDVLILELRGLTVEKQKEWIEKYAKFYPEKKIYSEEVERVKENIHVRKLLSQPVLLYMVVSSGFDVSKELSRSKVYEELIRFVVRRGWESIRKKHPNLKGLTPELSEGILKEVAFLIFKSDFEYAKGEDILRQPAVKKFCQEVLRREPKIENSSEIFSYLRGLLISFYFRKIPVVEEEEKETFAIEFYHKSIQEYMTAKYIYDTMLGLCNTDTKDEEIMETIWKLFSHKSISEEIRDYLEEIIEERREEDGVKQKELVEKLRNVFPKLLEIDFIVKLEELDKKFCKGFPLRKPLYTFRNFWIFAKAILGQDQPCYTQNLTREQRERFIDFIRYVQQDRHAFVVAFPLYNSNLQGLNLNDINLYKGNLSGANLRRAFLERTYLAEATLENADLRDAFFGYAKFIAANLEGAKLGSSRDNVIVFIERTNFLNAQLVGAELANLVFGEVNFRYANLSEASLKNVHFIKTRLEGANLENAKISEIKLNKTNLKRANKWQLAEYDEKLRKKLGLS